MKLSVVMASSNGIEALRGCLDSIAAAASRPGVEIIVVAPAESREELPANARFVPAPVGISLCESRALGARQATGQRIAMLGDRYRAGNAWIEAALEEGGAFQAVGGAVAPGPDFSFRGWCVYLAEYAHLAPPLSPGARHCPKDLAGGDIVYQRNVFDPALMAECGTELELHRRMLATGVTFGIDSRLDVKVAFVPAWGAYARERFQFSRRIARDRAKNASLWTRAIRAAARALLPFVALIRTAAAIGAKPRYWLRFAVCAPVLFLFGLVQAAGEFAGFLVSNGSNVSH